VKTAHSSQSLRPFGSPAEGILQCNKMLQHWLCGDVDCEFTHARPILHFRLATQFDQRRQLVQSTKSRFETEALLVP
ncbi:hypothetical protein, partial [Rhizobium ruizarguesonis]|uniref:hypothetical protein n=1 Tax=Rhizobium ruizarguesonis TaxID=2081791 RepID=UPI002ACC2388